MNGVGNGWRRIGRLRCARRSVYVNGYRAIALARHQIICVYLVLCRYVGDCNIVACIFVEDMRSYLHSQILYTSFCTARARAGV